MKAGGSNMERTAEAATIEYMEKREDIEGLQAFGEASKLESREDAARWAELAVGRLRQSAEIAKTTPDRQVAQVEGVGGDLEEVSSRTGEVDSEIGNVEKEIGTLEDSVASLHDEGPEIGEKIENKDMVTEQVETVEEKPLEVGDEVYKNGTFYKIHDFMPEGDSAISGDYFDAKNSHEIDPFTSRWEWEARRKQELDAEGIKAPRAMRLVITEGGVGRGKGGFEHNFNESQVTRVTPELREKIEKMKNESGRGDEFASG